MTQPESVFSALLASVQKAADFNRDDMTLPAVVLWPDERAEWATLVPRLRAALPQFLTFGPHDPAHRSGPAIWLRCVLAGKIAAVTLPPGTVPIIYLPGVSRSVFRDPESCPPELKPIFEIQFRGVIWSQVNAKDWTIAAYLQTAKGGLGLTVARDQATVTSLRRAVEKLADVPLVDLQAKSAAGELNGTYFDSLVSDDLVNDLLSWLSHPKEARGRWEPGRWETLCSRCLADYGFDPARDGELLGPDQLGTRPKGGASLFVTAEEFWPQDNEAEEAELRDSLKNLATDEHGSNTDKPKTTIPDPCSIRVSSVAEMRLRLIELEQKHGCRREWVWATLRQSPLAFAVQHLAALATVTATPW